MHYYQFNIGDYAVHTAHLEPLEDLAYRRLLDLYYLSEKPIPLDLESVSRLIRMRQHRDCIAFVLSEFFLKTSKGFVNKRADNEIASYKGRSDKASVAAKARWDKEKEKQRLKRDADALHEHSGRNAKHKTLTTKQETVTNKDITPTAPPATPKKNYLDYSSWPAMPSEQIMQDWLAMRKRLKANVSQTVINRFASELRKAATYGYTVDQCLAECVTRNWRGFEVQWMLNSKQPTGGNNGNQPKPSLIDRFIENNYGPAKDDYGPMGGDDRVIRGEVVQPVRGDAGRIGPMEADLIGDFKATGGGSFE